VSTSASDCLETHVREVTCHVPNRTIDSTHSLTHSVLMAVNAQLTRVQRTKTSNFFSRTDSLDKTNFTRLITAEQNEQQTDNNSQQSYSSTTRAHTYIRPHSLTHSLIGQGRLHHVDNSCSTQCTVLFYAHHQKTNTEKKL